MLILVFKLTTYFTIQPLEPNWPHKVVLGYPFLYFHDRTRTETPSFPDQTKAEASQIEPFKCPDGTYGDDCACFEDNAAYFGNNDRLGNENPQPSRHACQQSCQHHPSCKFWTWGKAEPTGPCYLKTKRDNVGYNLTSYVSGNKFCKLPEADEEGSRNRKHFFNFFRFCRVALVWLEIICSFIHRTSFYFRPGQFDKLCFICNLQIYNYCQIMICMLLPYWAGTCFGVVVT